MAELGATGGESIEMRRADLVVARTPHGPRALIVGENEEDIRHRSGESFDVDLLTACG